MNRVLLLGNIRPSLRLGLALLLALAMLGSPLAATPAAAAEKPSENQYKERDHEDDDNGNNNRHHKKKNNNRNNNNNGGGGSFETSQESEQEAESADINQSVTVESTGDNSTQCAGVQDVAQTGNAQNLTDLTQANSEADEFEFEEVGSTIDESPANSTECNQRVNQAAAASASADSCWTASDGWYYCSWSGWGTYYWDPYNATWVYWSPYRTVSDVATGILGSAGGLTSLAALATLGLVGTGLVIRRTRND
jgi:hypothetical protein